MPTDPEAPAVADATPVAAAAAALIASPPPPPAASEGEQLPELPLFSCKEAYVYRVPPASTVGHRAELWDVDRWLASVALKIFQSDDNAFVRLLDDKTGELFAECPVPTDKPLATAVEAVIDSSRYFVLRIVDRDSQRHAFIGIGFRERSEASDFNAALHEFLQYIKRKRTAEAMRHAYEERLQQSAEGGGAGDEEVAAGQHADLSIKEGETLTLKLAPRRPGIGAGFVSGGAAARRGMLGRSFSLMMDGHGGTVAGLSPPPAGGSPKLAMSLSPSLEAGGGSPLSSSGGWGGRVPHARLSGEADLQQRLQGLALQDAQAAGEAAASCSASVTSASSVGAAASAAEEEEEDFGDFAEAQAAEAEAQRPQQGQEAGAPTAG